jgi:hypothetical protein
VATFREVWGRVALHVPAAPASLVQIWVQSAYDDLVGKRHWAWTRRATVLRTQAARTIAVTFAQGSPALVSAALFLATDVGRQIRAGSATPIYTIASVTDPSNAVLTQPFAETGGTLAATLHDRYLAMPADFRSIEVVTDQANHRPVAWWISKERLDVQDPARTYTDSRFRVLASAGLSQVPTLLGRVLYEAWPSPAAEGSYTLAYFARMEPLVEDTEFQGVLATFTRSIEQKALADAARWPGTPQRKNAYFNLPLSRELEREALNATRELDVMDDDQYLMALQQTDLSRFGLAALSGDTPSLRSSDATTSDYWGG